VERYRAFSHIVLAAKGSSEVSGAACSRVRLDWSELCGFWGREHAILARLHGAVYQSAMRSPRSLASRRCHHSSWKRRPLPLLRRIPPQRSSAPWSALPHAPALPHRAPAPSSSSPL